MQVLKRAIAPVLVLVLAVGAIWYFGTRNNDKDENAAKQTQPSLPSIGVEAPTYLEEFNKTAATDPLDFSLDEPHWVHDDAINLDIASYSIGDWALVELYRNKSEEMTAVYVVARPTDAGQKNLFLSIGTSAIATALKINRDAASQILTNDLHANDATVQSLDKKIERLGLNFRLTLKDAAYQLTVTNAKASPPK
jgi:hypothetical protein